MFNFLSGSIVFYFSIDVVLTFSIYLYLCNSSTFLEEMRHTVYVNITLSGDLTNLGEMASIKMYPYRWLASEKLYGKGGNRGVWH